MRLELDLRQGDQDVLFQARDSTETRRPEGTLGVYRSVSLGLAVAF